MPKAYCPKCDTLREIVSRGEKKHDGYSAQWWYVEVHKHPDKPEICDGSGARI